MTPLSEVCRWTPSEQLACLEGLLRRASGHSAAAASAPAGRILDRLAWRLLMLIAELPQHDAQGSCF